MSVLYDATHRTVTWCGHDHDVTIRIGTLLRNTKTGDVGHVRWTYQRGEASDVLFKVDVWRLGKARLWYGNDIEPVEDDTCEE